MKIGGLASSLEACLSRRDANLQMSAAVALARLGPSGLGTLERVARQPETAGHRIAGEVAEKARIGRLQLATI